jgi:hypothetical protein
MVGHQAGSEDVQRVLSLTGSLDEMSVWDMLEGLLQVEHNVDAVRRGAPQNSLT